MRIAEALEHLLTLLVACILVWDPLDARVLVDAKSRTLSGQLAMRESLLLNINVLMIACFLWSNRSAHLLIVKKCLSTDIQIASPLINIVKWHLTTAFNVLKCQLLIAQMMWHEGHFV